MSKEPTTAQTVRMIIDRSLAEHGKVHKYYMSKIKYIPAAHLARLNAKAKRKGKSYVAPEAPIFSGHNVPVFRSWAGIDATAWVRCEIPADPDCLDTVFIDISTSDFAKLPEVAGVE